MTPELAAAIFPWLIVVQVLLLNVVIFYDMRSGPRKDKP